MDARAERGMSAPPEVVFSTATDPDRLSAWLPAPLRSVDPKPEIGGATQDAATEGGATEQSLRASWRGDAGSAGWSANLEVRPLEAGGATALLELMADDSDQPLTEIADESLANLAEEVAENLTAG